MKCPICGKEEFIKPETSLIISSYERLTVTPEIHVCVNCGFVIMQNAFLGEKYKKAIEEVNELKKEIEKLDQEIKTTTETKFYPNKIKARITNLKKKLPFAEESIEESKILDEISDLEKELKMNMFHSTERKLSELAQSRRKRVEQLNFIETNALKNFNKDYVSLSIK